MLKDITLGQFFPGKSLIHRLDPRAKLLILLVYFVALFLAKSYISYGLMVLFLAAATMIARIPFKSMTRGLKPMLIFIILTAVLNLLYTKGGRLLLSWKFIHIYTEGIKSAVFMALRIILLICGSFLLTYTTSPIALTDALERLLSPLKYIKVPVHELAMMMCIALRFIPTLIEETDKIMSAQKARGANFETGSLLKRAKALIPILYSGIMSGAAGFTLQIIGQRDTDPTIASLLMCLESVFAVLTGAIVLGEKMTVRETAGCILMFSAVILAQLSPVISSLRRDGRFRR